MDTFRADVKKELAKGTTTSKPSTAGKKLYRVQIGAYSVKANADKQLAKAKRARFENPKGMETQVGKSLTEKLFNAKVDIIRELQGTEYQTEEYINPLERTRYERRLRKGLW